MAFQCPICSARNTRVEDTKTDSISVDDVRIIYTKRKIYCWVCNLHFQDIEEKIENLARVRRKR